MHRKQTIKDHIQLRSYIIVAIMIIFIILSSSGAVDCSAESRHSLAPFKAFNIIMVWVDALRADHLSCYGHDRKTSPNIDSVALESVVFENNFTPNTVTISSFMSIITSLYPGSHGVFHIAKDKLSPQVKTLAEILKMYGYSNIWFGPKGDPHLDPKIGYSRGFDTVEYFPDDFDQARMVLSEALIKNKDVKFFLNFHTYKVHAPYLPSLKYKKKFTTQKKQEIVETFEELENVTYYLIKDGLSGKKNMVRDVFGEDLSRELIARGFFNGEFDPGMMYGVSQFLKNGNQEHKLDHLRYQAYFHKIDFSDVSQMDHLKSLYDAAILEFDTEIIGPLVSALKKLNLYENSIIILCADHGDEFGEHGRLSHGETLYDEVIHVPLIIKFPLPYEIKRIKELTLTIDIMPTLLDFLGIPIPYFSQGKSLLPLVRHHEAGPLHEFVYGQNLDGTLSIRSKEWKLILGVNYRKELYHILSDPQEKQNLYSFLSSPARKLKNKLKNWQGSLPSYRVEASFLPHIDKATRERIKKTGYW